MQPTRQPIDWKAVTTIVLTTLILAADHYRDLFASFTWSMLVLYLAVPLAVILIFFRESPAKYGFCAGNWKLGLVMSAVGILGITLLLPLVARLSSFKQYYAGNPGPLLPFILDTALGMVGWEFFFRGFLLFALARIAGPYAILLQAVPFTLAHFGKPELETLSCIFGGSAFGYVAWRTKSFLYPFLIHTYLAALIVILAQR